MKPKKIAMLIDGDNARATLIARVLAETEKYGQVSIRRIFGDWTRSNMQQWKKVQMFLSHVKELFAAHVKHK